RGSHTVEFAVALPIFLVFLWGIVDLGRGFMISSILTHAARAGCRAGVVPNATTGDVHGAVTAALNATSVSGTTTMVLVNRAHKVKHYLTDAARGACRLAILPGSSNDQVTAATNQTLIGFDIDPADATTSFLINGVPADLSTANQGDKIAVKVSVPVSKV